MNIPGFELLASKSHSKNLKSGNAPGGIAVFIRETRINLFETVKLENEDTIWVKVKKEATGEERDIFIGTCYFNPQRTNNKDSQQMSNLTENILFLKSKGHIIINGDLNARTGNLPDTILSDKYDEDFNICVNDNTLNRNSQDKKVNQRGNELLDLCKSLDLNILNGRKTGDPFGKYTCFNWNGSSVVDYLLTSDSLFSQMSSFKVGDFLPWLSDHCPLYSTLELHKCKVVSNHVTPREKAPKRFLWSHTGKQKYLNMLNTMEYTKKLESALKLDYGNTNEVVNCLSEVLLSVQPKRLK